MDRKTIMGLAAVAGIGLLLYMRRNADSASVAGAGNTLAAAGTAGLWGSNPLAINAYAAATGQNKPLAVDTAAASKPPAANPAPPPAASGSASHFVGVGNTAPEKDVKYWLWSDVGQGKNGIPIMDAGQVAELDGVRAFATQHDLSSNKGTQDVFAAARGQGLSYNDTLQKLGSAFGFTDREIADHAAQHGVTKW